MKMNVQQYTKPFQYFISSPVYPCTVSAVPQFFPCSPFCELHSEIPQSTRAQRQEASKKGFSL